MSTKSTRIMAAVSDHWLLGSLPLQDSRIREELNDSSTDFVQLHDVEVHAYAKLECVAKLSRMVVPKRKLEFIVAPSDTHEAPEKCWNNWTAKATFSAFAIVSKYLIQGTLHVPTTAIDPQRALPPVGHASTNSRRAWSRSNSGADLLACIARSPSVVASIAGRFSGSRNKVVTLTSERVACGTPRSVAWNFTCLTRKP